MSEATAHRFAAADGARLAYREVGDGRPIVLLHGYMVGAEDTWVRSGIAGRLADDGRRVIMPDLRGHGASARSHAAADYPPDALVDDGLALIDQLGLEEYDLGGYSIGGRVVARMLAIGTRPGRAVIAGTGLEPIVAAAGRGDSYRRLLADFAAGRLDTGAAAAAGASDPDRAEAPAGAGDPDRADTPAGAADPGPWDIGAYLRAVDADPIALTLVLDTFVDTPRAALEAIEVPTLVLAGEGEDRGSVEDLAAALPQATLRRVPGDHGTAHLSPEFTDALLAFLGA